MVRRDDWTKILGWPGYQVYQHGPDEKTKTLKLWVRRKRGTKKLICSRCSWHCGDIFDSTDRTMHDLPWPESKATLLVELYRVVCPDSGPKMEKVVQLPSKAPFANRFQELVDQSYSTALPRQLKLLFDLGQSTVRGINQRFLEWWSRSRNKPTLRQMGMVEIYMGEKTKFVTVVRNMKTSEPMWFGLERKKAAPDGFLRNQLTGWQRSWIRVAWVDKWDQFRLSIEEWAMNCDIIYDKFHIIGARVGPPVRPD